MAPARRWLAFLSAAIAAVLAVVLPVTIASAAGVSAAGTRVGASHPGMIFTVGPTRRVSAGEGRCEGLTQPGFVSGLCVAAEENTSPTCGGQSFTPGTKVVLASGALVAISKLRKGEKVLTTNTKTGKTTAETVAAVLVHHDTNRYDLTVKTARGTAVIDTTRSHLFWDQASKRWVKAGALKHGTRLSTSNRATATVISGHQPKAATGWMWDLTIPVDHDFYIKAATTAILVHNCPIAPGPANRATFVADASGTVVPTSASTLEAGLQSAVDSGEPGFSSFPTRSPGIGYELPNGETIRIMQPAGSAPLRASFEDSAGNPISPFTGSQVNAPPGVLGPAARQYVRMLTHITLGP